MEVIATILNDLLFGLGLGCLGTLVYYRNEIIGRIKKYIFGE